MEEPNPNQDRRRGHRSPTGEEQGIESESHTRRREHDRHRRRRDVFRSQLDQTTHRTPIPVAYCISPTPSRLEDSSEDGTVGNSALAPPPSENRISLPGSFLTAPIWIVDNSVGEVLGDLPVVSSLTDCPVPPGLRPVPPLSPRDGSETITPIQSSKQTTSRSDTLESEDVRPALFPHTMVSSRQLPLPTTTTDVSISDTACMEEILGGANRLRGSPLPGGAQTFRDYTQWGCQLAGSFKYETVVKNVKGIISGADLQQMTTDFDERAQNSNISADVYWLLQETNHDVARTTPSKCIKAFRFWQLNRYFTAETSRRLSLLSHEQGVHTNSVLGGIKLDFACVHSGLSREGLLTLRETNRRDYETLMGPINRLHDGGGVIGSYVETMGTPAALLIWPWKKAQQTTDLALHQHDMNFVSAMTEFIKGSHEFCAVQELLKHMSIWLEAWLKGEISSNLALGYLNRFLDGSSSNAEILSNEILSENLKRQRCREATYIMQRIGSSYRGTWSQGSLAMLTLGKLGNQISLPPPFISSLGPTRQLGENAIAAVLVTSDVPSNVTYCRAFLYGNYYNDRSYTNNWAVQIGAEATTILCPVYTGISGHWVGVVVRLSRRDAKHRVMTLELVDSHMHDADVSIYDEHTVMEMILTWLRDRLPDYDSFEAPSSMVHGRVAQETSKNSCGVHTLANLIAAGRSLDYPTYSSEEWVDAQRKRYLVQILRSAASNLRGEPGRNLIEISLLEIIEDLEECDEWGLKARRRRMRDCKCSFFRKCCNSG